MSPSPQHRDAPAASSSSLWRASTIMMVLSLLLSWLPIIGPAIAGYLGGREAASPTRALTVALLPAVLLAGIVWLLLAAFELPVLGAVAGFGIFALIAVQLAPLLVGAWFGGASREGPAGA